MNSASRTTRIFTILLLAAAVALSLPGTVISQTTTPEIFVTPAEEIATTCASTTVAIRVDNVVNLTGYHLDITYDAADLEVTDVVNGGFLGEPVNEEFYEPTNSWETPGVISFGMVQQNTAENPIQPRSGTGDLIIITLKAKATNASTAVTIDGETSQLVNWPEALPIEFTVTNGLVTTESCPPVAQDQSVTTAEDTPKSITLTATDPDLLDTLSYTSADPAHGSVTPTGSAVVYTPDANWHGTDSFTFTVNDGHGQTDTGTVTVEVTSVLDPPTLSSDDLAGPFMAGLQQEFHVTLTNPSYGDAFSNVLARFRLEDIALADIASFEYLETSVEPNVWLSLPLTQSGDDLVGAFGPSAGYPMSAPYNSTSTFRITFNAPVASPSMHPASVALYDLTPEPDVLLASYSTVGTLVDDLEVTDVALLQSTDQAIWDPIAGTFAGGFTMPLLTTEDWYYLDADTLTVNRELADGLYPFNFDVTPNGFLAYWAGRGVTAAADPTSWEYVMWQIVNGDLPIFFLKVDAGSYQLVDGLLYALDSTGDDLRINGTYWPGLYTFRGNVADEYGFEDELAVDITFDDIPLAEDQLVSTLEDLAVDINLTAVDHFNSGLDWLVVADPVHGTLSGTAPALTYTPALNWNGADSFTFQVTDGALVSNIATITINVTPGNDNPSLGAIGDQSVDELALLAFTATATDLDGDTALIYSLVAVAGETYPTGADINPLTGAFAWTPAENQGPDSYTVAVRVCDAGPLCDEEEITITVAEVNSAPALDTILAQQIDELVELAFTATAADDDLPAYNFSYALTGDIPTGAAITNAGAFSWIPTEAQGYGVYTFNVEVCDNGTPVLCDDQPVTVTVNEVNVAPVLASVGDQTVDEQVELVFTALATDADLPANDLTFSLVDGTAGTVPTNALIDPLTGAFSWTPDETEGGAAYTFDICVSDSTLEDCETITVTVNEVNVAAVAVDDAYETDEDVDLVVPLLSGLLENDIDTDFPVNTLTAIKVSDPLHGTLTLAPDGSFTYHPAADYLGIDSFTYKVNDGTTDSNVATVSINVHTVNDNPVANADSYNATEDTLLTVLVADGVLDNDTDVEFNPFTAQLVTQPASGTLTLNPSGAFTYMPAANVNGVITFTYRAYDTMGWSAPATVTITIAAVDDPTVALNQSVTTAEDTAKAITLGVTEVDGNSLVWTVGTPSHGTLSGSAPALTYTPSAHYFGPDSFTFSVNDGTSQSNTATVSITVTSVNDAPQAQDAAYSVEEDEILFEAVTATDVDNDALTYSVRTAPVHGGLILGVDGAFAYQPAKNYSGSDSFTFYALDGHGGNDWGTITITITEVNDDPVAVVDIYNGTEDTLLEVPAPGVLTNDTDVDDTDLMAVLLEGPSSGTFTLNNDGSFTYQPAPDFHGTVTFTYMASDGVGNSSTTIDIITIAPVNDPPVLAAIENKTIDELLTLAFTAAASDVDTGTLLAFSLEGQPAGAAITAAGAFSWTPSEAQGAGSYTFIVKVCDNAAIPLCDTQELTVTVNEVNLAPTASPQAVTTTEDTAKAITLAAADADSNPLTWTIVAQPLHGVLSGTAPALTYTPAPDFFGADSFTFKVNDGTLDSNTATVSITVTPVADTPVLGLIGPQTASEGVELTFTATATDGDPATTFTFTLAAGTAGAIPAGAAIDPLTGAFAWTPDETMGGASFTFDVCVSDGALTDCQTLTIPVTEVNAAPVISAQLPLVTDEDTSLEILVTDLTITDPDDTVFTLTVLDGTNYTHVGNVITPAADFNGPLTVIVTVNDGEADSAEFDLLVTVTPVNDLPVAADQTVTTDFETAADITLGATDVDGDDLIWIIVAQPLHGTLSGTAPALTYTPDAGHTGSDSFTFKVNDGTGDSNTATVTITVGTPVDFYIYLPMILR